MIFLDDPEMIFMVVDDYEIYVSTKGTGQVFVVVVVTRSTCAPYKGTGDTRSWVVDMVLFGTRLEIDDSL